MTGPIQRDFYSEWSEQTNQAKQEQSGLNHMQTEAYGGMTGKVDGDRNTAAHVGLPDLMIQARDKSEARLRAPSEGLDPMYHNFSYNILDPRSEIQPAWFDKPLSQRILSQMGDKAPSRELPAEAFRDGQGNLHQSIDLRDGKARLSANVTEGKRFDQSEVSLLFLKLKSSTEAKFDENVVEIANKLHVQGELFRVMELAKKIDDPLTRRGLQLAVLEESLRRNGSSYLEIASAGVFPSKPETSDDARKRMDEMLQRIREGREHPKPEQPQTVVERPGLTDQEQGELSQLCGALWSKDQLLWNMGRAKSNWSH